MFSGAKEMEMNIVVCVKRVPLTQDVDLKIEASAKEIDKSRLAYVMNEWDSYAAEQAVLMKEKFGGTVTVVTVGARESEEILRKVLAMGADRAVRVDPGARVLDGAVISKILSEIVKQMEFDIVLTGVQADDFNEGIVGSMMAGYLNVSHGAVVNGVECQDEGFVQVKVELEGGINEEFRIKLPAVLTIQSGINIPRYVSIMAVKKAAKKEMKTVRIEDLGLSEVDLTPHTVIEKIYLPTATGGAEIIGGTPQEVALMLLNIMKEKGVLGK